MPFKSQAWNMLTGPNTRRAFDLSQEDPKIRDRYGRNTWGQRCLLARRLVEAGVDLVTATLSGPLCGRVQNWDDHAVNHHIFDAMKSRAAPFDMAVSALIEDLHERGLDKRVLLIVAGDFGRTPRISYAPTAPQASCSPGEITGRTPCPSCSAARHCGGHVIGATDRRGEHATDRRAGVGDFLATVYRILALMPSMAQFAIPLAAPFHCCAAWGADP